MCHHYFEGFKMPSSSLKQHRLMQAVANNPKFAKKVGIKQSVGKEFEAADKAEGKFQKKVSETVVTHEQEPKSDSVRTFKDWFYENKDAY
jgi:hypothetical protein